MKNLFLIFIFVFIVSSSIAYAAPSEPTNAELLKEIRGLKAKINQLEDKVKKLEKKDSRIPTEKEIEKQVETHVERHVEKHMLGKIEEDIEKKKGLDLHGLKIGIGATMILQNAIDPNYTTENKKDTTDSGYHTVMELERQLGKNGYGYVEFEMGDGVGAMDKLEVFSNVDNNNCDTDNRVEITKAWYEHKFFDKQLAIAFGKWDPTDVADENNYAGDDTIQFFAEMFNNSPTFDRPDKAPGFWARIRPNNMPWFEAQAQLITGDGSWQDVDDHLQVIPEITIKPTFGEDLEGNYRFYGWYRNTDYIKWSNPSDTTEYRYGFGLSADQQITETIGIFGRYSWEDPNVYDPDVTASSGATFSLEQNWSAGLNLLGGLWGRKKDNIGMAIGMIMPSDKYKEYGGTNLKADDEGHAEVYYSWCVNDYLKITPDVQFIWNPFGNDYIVNGERRDGSITVVSCRAHFDF